MQKRKIKIGPSAFAASFERNTFNVEKRTVDIVWSTGARVKRWSWDGPYYEELSMKKDHIRLERLQAGASVLNNHSSRTLNDVIGVVEKASVVSGEGRATIRFSERPELAGLVKDIESGIIRNISVGYNIHKFEEVKARGEDDVPIYRATDWEPVEISFVAIPADYQAQVRSKEEDETGAYECEIITDNEDGNMGKRSDQTPVVETPVVETPVVETPVETPVVETPVVETPVVETPVENEQRTLEENSRQKQIREAVREAKLDPTFADKFLDDTKMSVEETRKAIITELARKSETTTTNNHRPEVKMEQQQLRKQAAVNGLLHRFDPKTYKLADADREFRQDSLIDLARKYLHSNGMTGAYDMPRRELIQRALHSTSDFPEILANVANKILRDAYEGVPNTFAPLVTMRNAKDFKELTSLQMGNGGTLQKVGESGEYKRTTLGENAEKFSVEKYGLIIGKTYELMVNDDLDAFTSIPKKLGIRAREKENQVFWDLFLSNPAMAETGSTLFHANHKNLAAVAAAISIASLSAGRAAMRLQKDLDGELASVKPVYLVVPAALETIAEQFISSVMANQNSQVNPFSGKLQIISEARLDASSLTAWYLAANAAASSIAEMAYLDGASGPEITTREGFDIDGMEVKIRHHFGMKFVDYRGLYKNAGV